MVLYGANSVLSSVSLFYQLLNHQRLKDFKYNSSQNSYEASFFPHPSESTQSQSPPTTQTATSPIQGDTLSPDSDQPVTEDDLLGILDFIPFQDYDSINLVNHHSQNLAHFCAQLRYHRLLTAVIERGADILAKDGNGWTPLDFARLHCDNNAIDILEGDWEDCIQGAISTGSFSTDPLRRFIPMLRSPALSRPGLEQEQSQPQGSSSSASAPSGSKKTKKKKKWKVPKLLRPSGKVPQQLVNHVAEEVQVKHGEAIRSPCKTPQVGGVY